MRRLPTLIAATLALGATMIAPTTAHAASLTFTVNPSTVVNLSGGSEDGQTAFQIELLGGPPRATVIYQDLTAELSAIAGCTDSLDGQTLTLDDHGDLEQDVVLTNCPTPGDPTPYQLLIVGGDATANPPTLGTLLASATANVKPPQRLSSTPAFDVYPSAEPFIDPPATPNAGNVAFDMVGKGLAANQTYTIQAAELDNACGGTTATSDGQNLGTGAVETTDFSGNLNVAVGGTGCMANSAPYRVVLETDGSPSQTSSLTIKQP